MKSAYDMVREFNLANAQTVNDQPTPVIPDGVRLLRVRLINEEYGELCAAIHEHDPELTADALADTLYVVVGTGVTYGVMILDTWRAPTRPWADLAARDVLTWLRRLSLNVSYVTRAIDDENIGQVSSGLRSLTFTLNRFAEELGIPLREVFAEVHKSNMTKRLGTHRPGDKYGSENPKGEGYQPPNIKKVLMEASIRDKSKEASALG